MKKFTKIISLVCVFVLTMGMASDAFADLSRIPSAMQEVTTMSQQNSGFLDNKNNNEVDIEEVANEEVSTELQTQYWNELFAVGEKTNEDQGNFTAKMDLSINTDEYDAKINLTLDAVMDTIAQKLEEKLSGSVYYNDQSYYLDQPEEGKASGSFMIRIIKNDVYLILEDLKTEGTAEEGLIGFDTILNTWVHFDVSEIFGSDFWEKSSTEIGADDLNLTSIENFETIFAELLAEEAQLSRIEAIQIARVFSLEKLFNINKTRNNSGQYIYTLTLRNDRLKRAFISMGEIIDEPLTESDIDDMDLVLNKITFNITFYVDIETNTLDSVRIIFNIGKIRELAIDNIYCKLAINFYDWDENTNIQPPKEYTELEDLFNDDYYYDEVNVEGENLEGTVINLEQGE